MQPELPGATIFQQPWWLDAVAPGQWQALSVRRGGRLVAWMPVVHQRRFGLRILGQPPLTQTLGPWLAPGTGRLAEQLGRQKDLLEDLVAQLPPHELFWQQLPPSFGYALPFFWKRFDLSVRYTYRLPELGDAAALWAGLRDNIRTDVRKARRQVAVVPGDGLEAVLSVLERTWKRQGRRMPVPPSLIERLDDACAQRGCRRILLAQDAAGRTHAFAYLVWDADSAYYLLGGGDPALRASGAASLLLWEAIQFAAGVTRSFDFEGSMVEAIERFFRAFGAHPTPYLRILHTNRLGRVLWAGREAYAAFAR